MTRTNGTNGTHSTPGANGANGANPPGPAAGPAAADADRGIEAALAGLATHAPATLAPAVLVEVGLADAWATLPSPLGEILVAWNGRGVSAISLPVDPAAFEERFIADHRRPLHRAATVPATLRRLIERRLAGDRRAIVPLDLRGATEFEQAVWRKTLEIPRGEIRPYGWVAAEIGRPLAVRAVGTALGHNPIPLVVPCHRVVRSDGLLGNYSMGGPENKRRILRIEGLDPDALEAEARAGIRYVGSNTTHVVCLPTCHNARRITAPQRVPFRGLREAAAAGYRPCRECRPAGVAAA
jgi:O-6-methylguanine DNA methyltransferase